MIILAELLIAGLKWWHYPWRNTSTRRQMILNAKIIIERLREERFAGVFVLLGVLILIFPVRAGAQTARTVQSGRFSALLPPAVPQDTLTQVGQWGGGDCIVVGVKGNYAFVGNGSVFQVFDITNPVKPILVGETNMPAYMAGLVISGNYAYTVPGFCIIDISDVTHPKLISTVYIPAATGAIAVKGNYAYVGNVYGDVYTIDISDPKASFVVNGYPMMRTQGGFTVSIIVVDTILYASSAEGTLVDIWNVSNATAPVHILNAFGFRGTLARQGHYLYLGVAGGRGALYVYDITDLTNPRYIDGVYLNLTFPNLGSICIKDTLAFVWEGSDGFEVVDIADTSNFHVIAKMPYLYHFPAEYIIGPNNGGFASGIAYIASVNGLWLVDVTNLSSINSVSFISTGMFSYVPNIATDSLHHAFLAEWYGGLKILDLSDPSLPHLLGQYNPDEAVWDVAVANNKAYVLCDTDMVVLDISDPTTPKELGKVVFDDTLNTNTGYNAANKLTIYGAIVYVARTSKHVYAIDVSDPSLPSITCSVRTVGVPLNAAKVRNYLYVAIADSGIEVFSASDRGRLRRSGIIQSKGMGWLVASGENLFSISNSGFSTFEIMDSLNLNLLGSCRVSYEYNSQIKLAKNLAFISYDNYFVMIDVTNYANPSIIYRYYDPSQFTSFTLLDDYMLISRPGNSLVVMKNELLTGISKDLPAPRDFQLYQNYPNPFNPATRISYALPHFGHVVIKVYDLLGREIRTLVDGERAAGRYTVDFDATNLPTEVYFYRLELDGKSMIRKMLLLK